MKIKMLRNAPHLMHCPLSEGQTGDVADRDGEELVKRGLALRLGEPEPIRTVAPVAEIQAVPPEPSISPEPVETPPADIETQPDAGPLSKAKRRKQRKQQTIETNSDKE